MVTILVCATSNASNTAFYSIALQQSVSFFIIFLSITDLLPFLVILLFSGKMCLPFVGMLHTLLVADFLD